MNIVIFGGAFDPIHNGHLNMANQASKQLDADVYFVPAPISIWKKESAPSVDKINMISLAIKGNNRFHIDEFEINSGKNDNYTVETIKYFSNKFPSDSLFLLIGSDQVNLFHKWKAADEIAKLAHIIYFERPNYQLNMENISRFKMTKIYGEMVDISSSQTRELGEINTTLDVLNYIFEHNLYYVKKLSNYVDKKRLNHMHEVGKLAYQIMSKNNIKDPWKGYLAGILHDAAKKEENNKEIVEKYFSEYIDLPSYTFHQFAGAYIAKNDFKIDDEEILDAIKFHCTGKEKMSVLGKIIYASDKIEPTRPFDSSELIQAMLDDYESGFIKVLKANKEFLESKSKTDNNILTYNCFKYYL